MQLEDGSVRGRSRGAGGGKRSWLGTRGGASHGGGNRWKTSAGPGQGAGTVGLPLAAEEVDRIGGRQLFDRDWLVKFDGRFAALLRQLSLATTGRPDAGLGRSRGDGGGGIGMGGGAGGVSTGGGAGPAAAAAAAGEGLEGMGGTWGAAAGGVQRSALLQGGLL